MKKKFLCQICPYTHGEASYLDCHWKTRHHCIFVEGSLGGGKNQYWLSTYRRLLKKGNMNCLVLGKGIEIGKNSILLYQTIYCHHCTIGASNVFENINILAVLHYTMFEIFVWPFGNLCFLEKGTNNNSRLAFFPLFFLLTWMHKMQKQKNCYDMLFRLAQKNQRVVLILWY